MWKSAVYIVERRDFEAFRRMQLIDHVNQIVNLHTIIPSPNTGTQFCDTT